MLNIQMKINSKFNNITFAQNKNVETNTNANIKKNEPDSFTKEDNIEPPEIKSSQIHLWGIDLTDEQIAQINMAKMLPENARFMYSFPRGRATPCYIIIPSVPPMNPDTPKIFTTKELGTRKLPDGYVVQRETFGVPRAVTVELEHKK